MATISQNITIDLDSKRIVRENNPLVGLRSYSFTEGNIYSGQINLIKNGASYSGTISSLIIEVGNDVNDIALVTSTTTSNAFSLSCNGYLLRNYLYEEASKEGIVSFSITVDGSAYDIENVPAVLISNPDANTGNVGTWNQITDKPTVFPPASHTHIISDVTGLQGDLDAKADASSLSSHTGNTSNPHNVTKTQVGLADVDNTSDANKPVSTAQQTALNLKVDKVSGKQLSTEDYSTTEKTKLSGIAAGAQVNVVTSVASKTGAVTLSASDISGLGTAATHPATDFATAAQGAKADSALQTVPTASPTVLGGIKIGTGLAIDGAGVVTASGMADAPSDWHQYARKNGAWESLGDVILLRNINGNAVITTSPTANDGGPLVITQTNGNITVNDPSLVVGLEVTYVSPSPFDARSLVNLSAHLGVYTAGISAASQPLLTGLTKLIELYTPTSSAVTVPPVLTGLIALQKIVAQGNHYTTLPDFTGLHAINFVDFRGYQGSSAAIDAAFISLAANAVVHGGYAGIAYGPNAATSASLAARTYLSSTLGWTIDA